MNGVVAAAELMADTALSAEQRNLVETIQVSGDILLWTANDYLDFVKTQAGKPLDLVQAEFDIHDIVCKVYKVVRVLSTQNSVRLVPPVFEPARVPVLSGDGPRIRGILINILSNALKFTAEGVVSVFVKLKDSELMIEVSDTGCGMDDERMERVFEQYEQADTTTPRRVGGTGLGLSVCAQQTKLLNGKIGVRRNVVAGSTFWFTAQVEPVADRSTVGSLAARSSFESERSQHSYMPAEVRAPREQSSGASAGTPAPEDDLMPEAARERPVLVVEDNVVNQLVITKLMARTGMTSEMANNGKDAVDLVAQHGLDHFGVVLMDVQMPVMDGHEATRRLREMGYTRPIVGLTAGVLEQDMRACLESGMTSVMTKPIAKWKLRQGLLAALNINQA